MRKWIDIITEGEVVSLSKHKTDKAMNAYADALRPLFKSEADFFQAGYKFMPFAKAYIESGFDSEMAPEFSIGVTFRDFKLTPHARELLNTMKRPWDVRRTKYAKVFPKEQREGPYADKNISFEEARSIWESRNNSPYGAYQPSRSGFRTSSQDIFDENGLGFNLTVGGFDDRREGEFSGQKFRQEYHVIDHDKDWSEVVNMMAAINRARVSSVK